MGKFKNFIKHGKYVFECVKLMPYAAMYKDEAEASRGIISGLKAQNRILAEQYKTQAETINTLLEMTK